MIRRSRRYRTDDLISYLTLVVGIIAIGVILAMMLRLQRGLLGIMLGVLSVVLLVYWLREIRRQIMGAGPPVRPRRPSWAFDLIESADSITLVGEVPGPDQEVRAVLDRKTLKVYGGGGFHREISLVGEAELLEKTYNNGILNIRLKIKKS